MGTFVLGSLTAVPASDGLDLLAEPTRLAIISLALEDKVGVVEIDPAISDTAATQAEFDLRPDVLANCVVVGGRREGTERFAACVVLANTRVDVNGVVRRILDVRKASFLSREQAVELTGMEYGGITPIRLPPTWPLLIDRRVEDADLLVIGSGIRKSKILISGAVLANLPSASVIDGLAQEMSL